jgi:hypothetical protein
MGKSKSGIPINRPNLDSERGRLLIPAGGISATSFNTHASRHNSGGADAISIKGLTDIIVCNENTVVCHNNNVITN